MDCETPEEGTAVKNFLQGDIIRIADSMEGQIMQYHQKISS